MASRSTFLQGAAIKVDLPHNRFPSRRFQVRAGTVSSNDLKNGLTLEIDSQPYRVMEFLHVKPGKGAAFVRSKLKNCITGSVLDKTFRAGETLTTADVQKRESQFVYTEGDNCVFMDMASYEEIRLEKDESWMKYIKVGSNVFLTTFEDKVIGVEPPQTIDLLVVEADEGIKGNTTSGGSHPVTLETGLVISAPLFVKQGDIIKIDTKRDTYLSRA